jgi:hypothetical protein
MIAKVLLVVLLLVQCFYAQLISVEYDLSDPLCSSAPLRAYSLPLNVCLKDNRYFGYYVTLPTSNTYIINGGPFNPNCPNQTYNLPLGIGLTDGSCYTPGNGGVPGAGGPSTRHYVWGKPPSPIPNPLPTSLVQYSSYADSMCTQFSSYRIAQFNQTKLQCFKRDSSVVETYTCTPSGVFVTYYKNNDPNNPPTTCAGDIIATAAFPFGTCQSDVMLGGDRYIQFVSCISSGSDNVIPTANILIFIGLIILALYSCE